MKQYQNLGQEIKKYAEGNLSIDINNIFKMIGNTAEGHKMFFEKNNLNFTLNRSTLISILESYIKDKYSKNQLQEWGRYIFNFLPIDYKDDDIMIAEVVELLYCIGEPGEGEFTKKTALNLIKRLGEESIRT